MQSLSTAHYKLHIDAKLWYKCKSTSIHKQVRTGKWQRENSACDIYRQTTELHQKLFTTR